MKDPSFLLDPGGKAGEPDGPVTGNDGLDRIRLAVGQNKTYVGLTAVLMLAVALRLTLRLGLSNRDSFNYILAAMKLNESGVTGYLSNIANIYENRVGIVFPLAAVLRLLGTTEFSTTLFPFLAALSTIVLVFVLGWQIAGPKAGLIAALIVAALPQEVGLSTSILPDNIIPLYTAACLLCLWLGLRQDKLWLYILSGVFLFLAFQSRATSTVLLVPLVLTAVWSSRRSIRAILTPAATFFVLLGLFWLLLYLIAGDPLVQYQWLVQDGSMENFAGTGEFMGHFRNTVLRLNPDFGLLFHLAILALIVAVLRSPKHEKYRLPLLAFVFLYLFLEFGTTSLTSYLPIWKLGRFLTILTVPAALLIAFAADDIVSAEGRGRRYLVFALLSAQIVLGVAYVFMFGEFITTAVNVEKDSYERVIRRLDEYDGATVAFSGNRWADWGTVYAAFQGNRFQFQPLTNLARDDLEPGTIVIFAPTEITVHGNKTIDRDAYPALAGLPGEVPPGWDLLFVEPLMKTGAQDLGDSIMIYQVGE